MRGSESQHATEGLPEERKALAVRYTIDAEEAQRREQLAAEVTAAQAGSADLESATVYPNLAPAGEAAPPATAPPLSRQVPSLKERLGRVLNHPDNLVADVRLRASESQEAPLRCARCGRECSGEAENWTLRLCGDDQLHAVCRDCDERDFRDARGLGGSLSLRPLPE